MIRTPSALLTSIIVVEAVLVGVATAVIMAHAGWRKAHEERRRSRFARGRPLLVDALLNGSDERLVEWLLSQPMSQRVDMCIEFAGAVDGHALERLQAVAVRVGVTAFAAAACRSRRWRRRLLGARALTALSRHAQAPELLHLMMNDTNPLLRAQAIAWASRGMTASTVALVVERLADPSALVRLAAQDAVRGTGDMAIEPLLYFLRGRSGRDCHVALQAMSGIASPALLSAVLALSGDACAETRAIATSMLGVLGGAEGVPPLRRALHDTSPAVRAAATHAIGQLGHWPAAPALAPLLADAHFGVRREAATALRRLGAPGVLLLRKATQGPDAAAASMARHVMSLPEPVFSDRAAA